jgi:stage V sporulation protein G
MKITRFSLTNGTTNTKAHFDIETSDGIILKGFQVVEGRDSLFVRAPKERGKDNQWYDRVILPEPLKSDLAEMAVNEYNDRKNH